MRPTTALLASLPSRSKTIGFIGLGAMGKEMASHLLTKSFARHPDASFVVCDADPTTLTRFLTAQTSLHPGRMLSPAQSPASVARAASTVITMLPSSPQVNEVYLGSQGILEGLEDAGLANGAGGGGASSESLFIDCTTCDRQTGVDVAATLQQSPSSPAMIDAPVSGGVAGAAAATLTFLVGSNSAETFAKAEPHLLNMGSRAIHCGPSGTGLTAKIANNLVLGATMLATSEAMALAMRGGLSPQVSSKLHEMIFLPPCIRSSPAPSLIIERSTSRSTSR